MPVLGKWPLARTLLVLLWGAGALFGLYIAAVYSTTSGDSGNQPVRWPPAAELTLATDRPTLLLTLHPRCVCSHATLEELARLLAQISAPLKVEVLVYQPANAPNWGAAPLVEKARSIPGIVVRPDPNGAESARFGMSVSGHAALYSPAGELLFTGGITRARGHAGDNAGRSSIVSLVAGLTPEATRTNVFGCSIKELN